MRESLRFEGKILNATVSKKGARWFVSFAIELPGDRYPSTIENQGVVGVDLGVRNLATLSTGQSIAGPKALRSSLRRLRLRSRQLSRKQKGSNNRKRAKAKLAKLHARISNIRQNSLHQLTSHLSQNFGVIGIENLNVKGMMKNRRLSKAVADMGFYEFCRQLKYKTEWRHGIVVVADMFFPSSKQCSACGQRIESLPLNVRSWRCEHCGVEHDRDVNAAMNLRDLAVSSTVSACGEESAGLGDTSLAKLASMKQEESIKPCHS